MWGQRGKGRERVRTRVDSTASGLSSWRGTVTAELSLWEEPVGRGREPTVCVFGRVELGCWWQRQDGGCAEESRSEGQTWLEV